MAPKIYNKSATLAEKVYISLKAAKRKTNVNP